jgi:hypothetical protein
MFRLTTEKINMFGNLERKFYHFDDAWHLTNWLVGYTGCEPTKIKVEEVFDHEVIPYALSDH